MNESFLARAKTIPHSNRDFVEWHGGIPHYGFWAVLAGGKGWLEMLEAARSHVKQFIHPGYRRGPHITVFACGLLHEDHFSSRLQRRQAAALREANLAPFLLRAGALDSFAAAPYIAAEDPNGSLDRIRSMLAAISQEDNPADYRPHVTLGLYREAFDTAVVADHLQRFRPEQAISLPVTELAFCAYETGDIQGPFAVLERVALRSRGN